MTCAAKTAFIPAFQPLTIQQLLDTGTTGSSFIEWVPVNPRCCWCGRKFCRRTRCRVNYHNAMFVARRA